MKPIVILFLVISIMISRAGNAQHLKAGFDAKEYMEMLSVFEKHFDTAKLSDIVLPPVDYTRIYRSPVVALKNRWELWLRKDSVAVICLRGTTADPVSWQENFYAAMVPASGTLQLNDSTIFNYQLASRADATVHTGWLTGIGYLSPTILEKVKEWHAKGVREFIIMGHSQGGALAFLLRSHLHYLMKKKELPENLIFKTYCSAAPKPGNLFYAYDFEHITSNGWGFTVLNASDWVPETPFTVQTLDDFNATNPFIVAPYVLKKLPLLPRIVLKSKYNKINRSTRKAQKHLRKNLGDLMYTQIRKAQPQLRKPAFVKGMNYMRAGTPIILMPDSAYQMKYPDNDPAQIFRHHLMEPYYILAQKYLQSSGQYNTWHPSQ
ncbi:MAG: lipase family protein [Chitinophagaceae bacterium]|nr:lipase family protein [Chitinophagaceae bacterium]